MSPPRPLVPRAIESHVRPARLGIACGPTFFVLLAAGLIWLGPALADARYVYAMAVWDALLVCAWAVDLSALPAPASFVIRRSWAAPLSVSTPVPVAVTIMNASGRPIDAIVTDAAPRTLRSEPPTDRVRIEAGGEAQVAYVAVPAARGEVEIGEAYLRYRSPLGFAERWGRAPISQTVVVYPNLGTRAAPFPSARGRPGASARRCRRIGREGRSFESLREHRDGDEHRDICWTASARRGMLVTRQFEAERSRPVWIVIDAGRLMRASIANVTKLDQAIEAAAGLARAALAAGDRVGLLVYGRRVVHRLPASRGGLHLRRMIDVLTVARPEESEADHVGAAARLMADQKRRGLIVWLTDVPDTAMTPEVVTAAARLAPRHVVLFVVIGDPRLVDVARRRPESSGEMYETAAAQEIVHRREFLLAGLRARGVLVVETPENLPAALVTTYLDVKLGDRL